MVKMVVIILFNFYPTRVGVEILMHGLWRTNYFIRKG